MNSAVPFEMSEFENLRRKPNRDPTWLGGFGMHLLAPSI